MLTLIAAIANNNVLGKDNKLIWHLPADLKRFKKTTTGHCVIMGRKTYQSLGKPLPNRTNIVVTRNTDFNPEGCVVVHSLKEAIDAAKADDNTFILGGAQIYQQAMAVADVLDLTFVHYTFEGDVFFPEIDLIIWKETSRQDFKADDKNKYDYSFVRFEKIRK
ncbi:MAG: dihydrofolate reductase [Flavobacteriaceae bacterium]|nr:dihydrofolate reductase [Flavobacteriaceae bacterium]